MLSRCTLALAALVAGCTASTKDGTGSNPGPCDNSTVKIDGYVAGITKTSDKSTFQVKIIDATPAPPASGANRWNVQLLDMQGKPLSSGGIGKLKTWMPDHGHGGNVTPEASTMDAQGKCAIDKLEFVMAGVWQAMIYSADGQDRTVFAFCIDG